MSRYGDRHAPALRARRACRGTGSATSASAPTTGPASCRPARRCTTRRCTSSTPGNVNIVDIRAKARRMKTGRQGLSMIIVDYLQLMTAPRRAPPRQPSAGGRRDLPVAEAPGEGALDPGRRALAAEPQPRGARRQAAAALGPPRVGRDRAGLRRRDVHPPRRRRPGEQARGRADHREAPQRADRQGACCTSSPRSRSSATPRASRPSERARPAQRHAPAPPGDPRPAREALRAARRRRARPTRSTS